MRATRDQLPLLFGTERAAIRGTDWGKLRATIVSIPAGTDITPLLMGLPNHRCPRPHWVLPTGEMRVTFADGEETVRAGDLSSAAGAYRIGPPRCRVRRIQPTRRVRRLPGSRGAQHRYHHGIVTTSSWWTWVSAIGKNWVR